MLLLWVSPILLFLGLVSTSRVSTLTAALMALCASAVVVVGFGPTAVSASTFVSILIAGAWIAVPAVLVILAGLYFTEVLAAAGLRRSESVEAKPVSARELGTICLFLGPFVETATGFGVGYVVVVSAMLRAGISSAAALAMGAFSQGLVPWGALGVGTKISASIAGIALDDLTWRIAIVTAPVLCAMLFAYWRIAAVSGIEISRAQRREDAATVAALSLLLIGTNRVFPVELAGLLAIGPVLMFRLWRSDGRRLLSRRALERGLPYGFLLVLLALTKLVPEVREAVQAPSFTPGQGAPLFAPLASPAISLVAASLLGCLAHGHWRGLAAGVAPTLRKGMRASVLTILLVTLAWIIVRAGVAEAFTEAMRGWIGNRAPLTVPVLGSLGGYLTGSNTGAGSLAMPVAKSVAASGDLLFWTAASAIVAGSVFTAFSPVRFAMGQAIAAAGKPEAAAALRLLVPFAMATVGIAVGAVLLAGLSPG